MMGDWKLANRIALGSLTPSSMRNNEAEFRNHLKKTMDIIIEGADIVKDYTVNKNFCVDIYSVGAIDSHDISLFEKVYNNCKFSNDEGCNFTFTCPSSDMVEYIKTDPVDILTKHLEDMKRKSQILEKSSDNTEDSEKENGVNWLVVFVLVIAIIALVVKV